MEIEIGQFRNLHDRNFIFHEGMNLLSGNNGRGKSNLLACIEWVLFGTCHGGSVLPWGKKKASATLTFPERKFSICRKKGPELLVFTRFSGEEYKDKEASELIQAYFGSPEVWRATCFVPQECRCPLLSGTKEQQINTLNALIFSNCDPSLIQKKIDAKRKEEEQEVKVLKGRIEGMTQGLSLMEVKDMDIQQVKMVLMFIQQQCQNMERSEKERFQLEYQFSLLQKEKKELEERDEKIKDVGSNDIEMLEKEVKQMKEMLPQVKMIEQFKSKISSLRQELEKLPAPVGGREYSEEEYNRRRMLEFNFQQNKKKCSQLGISYDREEVEKNLVELRKILESIPYLKDYQRKHQLVEKLTSLWKDGFKEDKTEEINELEREIYLHEKNKDTLMCPSCENPLVFTQGKLAPSSGFVVDVKRLEEMKMRLLQLKMYQRKHQEMTIHEEKLLEAGKELQEAIEQLKEKMVENVFLDKEAYYHQRLSALESVQIFEQPENVEEYGLQMKALTLQRELKEWEGKDYVNTETVSFEELQRQLTVDEQKLQWLKMEKLQKEQLSERRMEVEKKLEKIILPENKENELEEMKRGEKNLQEKLERLKLQEEMKKKQEILQSYQNDVEKKQERVSKIETIREICRKVQSERIDFSLYSLNSITNEILKEMFEEPISIEIKASKETKQGKIKNELGLIINHNQNVLTNLRPDLSVGQASRVSMALSLALFLLTPCPFILLDEPFAPVDKEMIDQSLAAIKDVLPKGRIGIISAHDSNGLYDHEVHLS